MPSLKTMLMVSGGFPVVQQVKSPPAVQEPQRHRFDPWGRKIPWKRKRQPAPAFLPRASQGQRSLAGHSPWGHRVGHDGVSMLLTLSACHGV